MSQINLTTPLRANEIDFRVQSIAKRQIDGKWQVCAIMLAYKDARCDMNRLDAVYGVTGWQRKHSRDNANCTVSVWCAEKKQWVEKEDTGTESYSEAAKGLASDSFKRACFNLGIGRELYDYPEIAIPLIFNENKFETEYEEDKDGNKKKYKQGFAFKPKELIWFNQFNEDGELAYLACKQLKGGVFNMRYEFGKYEKPDA